MSERFILLTGCSGGGKSTLLDALGGAGFATVPEPGRRIVAGEMAGDGRALPWVDMKAFAGRAVAMARADLEAARHLDGTVFFDRGLVDAAVALAHAGGPSVRETLGDVRAYAEQVLVVPPWPEIFAGDAERRHGFDAAVAEHERITGALGDLGYRVLEVPRMPVPERVAFVLRVCGADQE